MSPCAHSFWVMIRGSEIFCISYAGPSRANMRRCLKTSSSRPGTRRLFPRMQIKRSVENDIYTTKRGYRRWTSVMGSMTGMGGDIFIVDDPIKPIDCRSQVKRDGVNEWLQPHAISAARQQGEGSDPARDAAAAYRRSLRAMCCGISRAGNIFACPLIAEMPEDVEIGAAGCTNGRSAKY